MQLLHHDSQRTNSSPLPITQRSCISDDALRCASLIRYSNDLKRHATLSVFSSYVDKILLEKKDTFLVHMTQAKPVKFSEGADFFSRTQRRRCVLIHTS